MHELIPPLASHRPDQQTHRRRESAEVGVAVVAAVQGIRHLSEQVDAQHRVQVDEEHHDGRNIEELWDGQDEGIEKLVESLQEANQPEEAGDSEDADRADDSGKLGAVPARVAIERFKHPDGIAHENAREVETIPVFPEIVLAHRGKLQGSLEVERNSEESAHRRQELVVCRAWARECLHAQADGVHDDASHDEPLERRCGDDLDQVRPSRRQLLQICLEEELLLQIERLLEADPGQLGLRDHQLPTVILLLPVVVDDHSYAEVQHEKASQHDEGYKHDAPQPLVLITLRLLVRPDAIHAGQHEVDPTLRGANLEQRDHALLQVVEVLVSVDPPSVLLHTERRVQDQSAA
mmetsp:Transcript_108169/g.272140  ORF Transcript_108169/g.272140 Transcript_108169/m.272140 type:complete len:350 (-) Transcript_108169:322-1371(-)